jgi:hypothetical protein
MCIGSDLFKKFERVDKRSIFFKNFGCIYYFASNEKVFNGFEIALGLIIRPLQMLRIEEN